MLDCIEYMKNVAIEERPSVCATMARECGFTGLSVLHRLYAAYGFNVLKDLVFDGMHDVPLNVIKHHFEVQLELGLLNKASDWKPCHGHQVTFKIILLKLFIMLFLYLIRTQRW